MVGLLSLLGKQANRLSGNTAQIALREMRKDSFILTPDVCTVLIQEAVATKTLVAARHGGGAGGFQQMAR